MVVSKYSFNYCRQASFLAWYLLNTLLPDFEWEVWESNWYCTVKTLKQGENEAAFDHAWLYGKNQSGRKLTVDLTLNKLDSSLVHVNWDTFRVVEGNHFPNDMLDYENVKINYKNKIDVPVQMNTQEFYTTLKGKEILNRVIAIMENRQSLLELMK